MNIRITHSNKALNLPKMKDNNDSFEETKSARASSSNSKLNMGESSLQSEGTTHSSLNYSESSEMTSFAHFEDLEVILEKGESKCCDEKPLLHYTNDEIDLLCAKLEEKSQACNVEVQKVEYVKDLADETRRLCQETMAKIDNFISVSENDLSTMLVD